jgi:hypothetical protein
MVRMVMVLAAMPKEKIRTISLTLLRFRAIRYYLSTTFAFLFFRLLKSVMISALGSHYGVCRRCSLLYAAAASGCGSDPYLVLLRLPCRYRASFFLARGCIINAL